LLRLEGHLLYEVAGNCRRITISFTCIEADCPLLTGAFLGEYPECELSPLDFHAEDRFGTLNWEHVQIREFYP